MTTIKAILFDLDGVLVDACDWHFRALNDALDDMGYPIISREDHNKTFNGLPTRIKLKMLGVDESQINQINKLKQKYTINTIKKYGKTMPEKVELLSSLKKSGYIVGCVTNSIRKTAETMLRVTGQYDYIDILVTNEDVINSKPSPDPYNFAIDKLKLDPKTVMCVEDSDIGLRSAFTSKASYVLPVKNASDVNELYILDIIKQLKESK